MKIALCLFGNVGHQQIQNIRKKKPGFDSMKEAFKPKGTGWSNPAVAAKAFAKSMADHDVETFIHSWSIDYKQELLDLYIPSRYEICEQTRFGSDVEKYGLIGTDMTKWKVSESARFGYKVLLPSRGSVEAIRNEIQELSFRTESRWWSNMRVLEFKAAHEKKHEFKFDLVIVSRLDTVFRQPIPFADLDPAKFYGSRRYGRPDEEHAYYDYFFISGSDNMDKFATLYNDRYHYSVRPTFACREHVVRTMGQDVVDFLFTHNKEYTLVRGL